MYSTCTNNVHVHVYTYTCTCIVQYMCVYTMISHTWQLSSSAFLFCDLLLVIFMFVLTSCEIVVSVDWKDMI